MSTHDLYRIPAELRTWDVPATGDARFTWEYDAHLYLKRSKWVRPAFGDSDFHYDRVIAIGEK